MSAWVQELHALNRMMSTEQQSCLLNYGAVCISKVKAPFDKEDDKSDPPAGFCDQ